MENKTIEKQNKIIFPLVLIISLFFMWGVVHNLNDILISQFKKALQLSDLQSGLVQSSFLLGSFFFALPASIVIHKYSYKIGIIVGLLLFATGAFLFYPAAQNASYYFFLFALFVIASGLAFLETAANPFVTVLGPPESTTLRLNLAQAFNPVGCITGILIGQHCIFSGVEHSSEMLSQMSETAISAYYMSEIRAVEIPYICIGITALLFALLFVVTRSPKTNESKSKKKEPLVLGLKKLAKVKQLRKAAVAQFFYLGAQVGIWSFLIRYIKCNIEGTSDISAANYLTWSLIALTLGRFIGTFLLKYIKSSKLLTSYARINIVLIFIVILSPNILGVWALVGTSFFMSIMFSIGIAGLGEDTKLASSVLVMAIVGGAILAIVMGQVSDLIGITYSYIIPLFRFLVIGLFGLSMSKTEKKSYINN